MTLLFLTPIVLASAVAQDPVGGREAAFWSSTADNNSDSAIMDVTGDGLPDVLRRGMDSLTVIEGSTWVDWYSCPDLGPSDRCTWTLTGDVTGDGIDDLVLMNADYPNPAQPDETIGSVWVVEGGSGVELWRYFGPVVDSNLGIGVSLADLDGDGIDDVLTSHLESYRTALSGIDGHVIWTVQDSNLEYAIFVDDINQDGIVELLTGREKRWDALIDGATGTELWRTQRGFQGRLAADEVVTYDVTADGIPDLLVGEPTARKRNRGWISVRDGATGKLIWKHRGRDREDAIGGGLQLVDLTGDGFPELLTENFPENSQEPANLYAYDARTGQQLWRKEWYSDYDLGFPLLRTDLNGDQIPDFVHSSINRAGDQSSLVAFDAGTGLGIWLPKKKYIDATITDLDLVDANSDGVTDIVVGINDFRLGEEHARIEVLNGRDGALIWSSPKDMYSENLHFEVVSYPISGSTGAVAAVQFTESTDEDHRLIAFDARNGDQLWESLWSYTSDSDRELGQLRSVDWNNDGQVELAWTPCPCQWSYSRRIRLWDPYGTEKLLWGTDAIKVYARYSWDDPVLDIDGDGWLDINYRGQFRDDFGYDSGSFHIISGRNGTWKSGLELVNPTVSASAGGTNELQIAAGELRAGFPYRVLFSENGQGLASYNGLDLPLAAGAWLTRTIIGAYPEGVFSQPVGTLDSEGQAVVTIDVPANALLGWVGRTLAFATVTIDQVSGDATWSTGYAELEVVQ